MPKSRGRNNRKGRHVTKEFINRRTREIIEAQRERFRAKFGRDWGPDDPVFFDPDASEPVPMSAVKVEAEVVEIMRKTGTPPQIIYAYKRTGGLLLTEDMREHWPPDRVKEWDDAIAEYFAIEDATKNSNRPNPKEWSTEIPEMLASGFDQKDFEKVREILATLAPIEGGKPMTVAARIELAAAFLVTACSAAYDSAEATGSPGEGPSLYAKTEELVVRRAREIYAQGSAGSD